MGQQNILTFISEADYLEGEKNSQIRHEYVAGQVFAMTETSRKHNRIALNLARLFEDRIQAHCEVYMSDVKLRIAHRQSYYYPDLLVGCDAQDNHDYYLERPCLIVEVLSDSTETTDRREKLLAYQSIPKLKAYVIVSQKQQQIEMYTPLDVQHWQHTIYTQTEEELLLPCLEGAISIAEVYTGIALADIQSN